MVTATANGRICRNFINGECVASRSMRTVERRNPADVEEVVSVVPLSTAEEAVNVANSVRCGLSSSLYTNDAAKMFAFIERIETGVTHINSPTVGGEAHLPFGGVKATGVGLREMGHVAVDFFTEVKSVYIDFTGGKRESRTY